jgi:hypothetical protein
VSAGGARRGRRDNGLHAAEYASAGDVDPRVGEHLLDVLAASGIAAYLQPSADLNPVLRTTTFPARPTDRLFVDSTHVDVARNHLSKLGDDARLTGAPKPRDRDPRQRDVDAEWERIIAGFDTDVDPAAAPWPEAEGLPAKEPEPAEPPTELPWAVDLAGIDPGRRTDEPPSLLDALDATGDADERYTPPPPPPLPRISKYTVAGLVAVLAGFLLFLFPQVVPIDRDFAMLGGFAGVLGGAVTLVWRLRSGDDDDDFDDGAVV